MNFDLYEALKEAAWQEFLAVWRDYWKFYPVMGVSKADLDRARQTCFEKQTALYKRFYETQAGGAVA